MQSLKALEIWFVTGSQHLYGSETLAQVAAHAATMAESLGEQEALPVRVLIMPVKTEEDELAGMMLAHLMALGGVGSETLSAKTLANETLEAVAAKGVSVVCLSAVRPFAVMQARYLAKRLRAQFPDLKILVGLWDGKRPAAGSHRNLQSAPADWVVDTLAQAISEVCPVVHCGPCAAVPDAIPPETSEAQKTHALVGSEG